MKRILAVAIGIAILLVLMALDLRFAVTGVTAHILNVIVGTAESLPHDR